MAPLLVQELDALRTSIRDVLAERTVPGATFDPVLWEEIGGLGWLSLSVPEELDGLGLGLAEETVLAEEAGYALLAGPLLSVLAFGVPTMLAAGDSARLAELTTGQRAVAFAWGEDGACSFADLPGSPATTLRDGRVDGRKQWVPGAPFATFFVLTASTATGLALATVETVTDSVSVHTVEAVDLTLPFGDVSFTGAAADLTVGPPRAESIVRTCACRALVLAAAESVGLARFALDLAVAHAQTREQFGRPIGSFQAVSHQLADTYVQIMLSRSLVKWAAGRVQDGGPDADLAASAAAAKALPAAVRACEMGIQVHGGMGMTWENPLHRYYKRALTLSAVAGGARRHRERVAAAVFGDCA